MAIVGQAAAAADDGAIGPKVGGGKHRVDTTEGGGGGGAIGEMSPFCDDGEGERIAVLSSQSRASRVGSRAEGSESDALPQPAAIERAVSHLSV